MPKTVSSEKVAFVQSLIARHHTYRHTNRLVTDKFGEGISFPVFNRLKTEFFKLPINYCPYCGRIMEEKE